MSIANWFKDNKNAGTVSGLSFSTLHVTAFGRSEHGLIQNLGIASLALTASVLSVKNLVKVNKTLKQQLTPLLEKINAPDYDSLGFPLFLNGVILGGIALASFAKGDFTSGSIALTYAMANTDKGARLSGNDKWTVENVFTNTFKKASSLPIGDNLPVAFRMAAEEPSRFIKHSLYLPEFWGSAGAFAFAISHSGWLAIPGVAFASIGVAHAAINNGDNKQRAQIETEDGRVTIAGKLLERISKVSDKLQSEDIDTNNQGLSRRYMKYASFSYFGIALSGGNILPAIGHAAGGIGNWVLERADKERQKTALSSMQATPV